MTHFAIALLYERNLIELCLFKFPTDDTRKSSRNNPKYDNANLNFPPETPSEDILESVLRDLILETEQKVNDGCLGSLKVSDIPSNSRTKHFDLERNKNTILFITFFSQ